MRHGNDFGRRGATPPPATPSVPRSPQPNRFPTILIAAAVVIGIAFVGWNTKRDATEEGPVPDATAIIPDGSQAVSSSVVTTGKMWVTSDQLARHTCPSSACGIVGRLFFRESATVIEINGEWARITKHYDAACTNGKSDYVDRGQASCTADNGIQDGMFAEWVETKYLSPNRPPDPAEGATGLSKLVSGSDDFRIHEAAFVKAAQQLIVNGECSEADFLEMGGFVKSTNKTGPVYFIYCGGMTVANRIYLDVSTGRTYR